MTQFGVMYSDLYTHAHQNTHSLTWLHTICEISHCTTISVTQKTTTFLPSSLATIAVGTHLKCALESERRALIEVDTLVLSSCHNSEGPHRAVRNAIDELAMGRNLAYSTARVPQENMSKPGHVDGTQTPTMFE